MKDKRRENAYSHIVKYTGLFGGIQGLGILVGVVRNKLIALILGPAGMGLISLFNSSTKLISDSTNLGISMSAVREISEAYKNNNLFQLQHNIEVIRSWCLLTALIGMMVCLLLSPWLSEWVFGSDKYTIHFMLLSIVVGLTAVTGGETAILKGVRKLKSLATISIYTIIGALIISIPLYYFRGNSAIVPSLILLALLEISVTLIYSYHYCPPSFSMHKGVLNDGLDMIKLGIAFVLAGILGSGSSFLIRTFLTTNASVEIMGLYNTGYMLVITYAGIVFSAMEPDYFPRLSSIKSNGKELSEVVNRQVEVCFLILSPMLVFLLISMPIMIPLLLSGKFLPVIGMTQLATLGMYLRSFSLPISYIALAKGDSKTYLLMEAIYDVCVVLLIIFGYEHGGLTGTGLAVVLAYLIEVTVLILYMRHKYGYKLSAEVVRYASVQLPIGLFAYAISYVSNPAVYWTGGLLLIIASVLVSVRIMKHYTNLWEKLKHKLRNR